jgi:hypothetical protein
VPSDDPPKKKMRLDELDDIDDLSESDERPTAIPPFDPEAFARDSETRQRTAPSATMDEARQLHANGKYEDALFVMAKLLESSPPHPEASTLSAACRTALESECLAQIGSEHAILVAASTPDQLKEFELDNVSGFLVSLLDGTTDVETVLDLSGLPRLLALRHLRDLLRRGIVSRVR